MGRAEQVATPTTSPGALLQGYLQFLPGGDRVVFFTLNSDGAKSGIYSLDVRTGDTVLVSNAFSRAQFAAGRLFFSRDGKLFGQTFDPSSSTLSGEPIRLVDDVGRSGGASRFNYAFSIAGDGRWRIGAARPRR